MFVGDGDVAGLMDVSRFSSRWMRLSSPNERERTRSSGQRIKIKTETRKAPATDQCAPPDGRAMNDLEPCPYSLL